MEKADFDKQKINVKAALGIIDTVLNGEVSRENMRQCEKNPTNSFFFLSDFCALFSLPLLIVFRNYAKQLRRMQKTSTHGRGTKGQVGLIPPSLVFHDAPRTTGSSCGSLDGGGRGDVVGFGLLSRSLSGLGLLLSELLFSGSVLGDRLGLVFSLGLRVGRSLLFLVVQLHGLAGLAEKTAELVSLLALSILSVGGVALLLTKVAEERGAALVLGGLGRRLGSRGVLGSLTFSRSGHALRLDGLASSTLDRVVELRSGAGDRGLSGSRSLLLSLLLRGAADLLEEVAEQGAALGLLSLLVLLLLFVVLLLLLRLLLLFFLVLFLLLSLVLLLILSRFGSRSCSQLALCCYVVLCTAYSPSAGASV